MAIPSITSITPNRFDDGRAVTLAGSGFGAAQGAVRVGGQAQTVTAWSDTSITFTTVRPSTVLGACRVDVAPGEVGAIPLAHTQTFTLSGVFPAKAQAAPIYYSDFDSVAAGTVHTDLGFTTDDGVDRSPNAYVTDTRAYTGGKCLRVDYATGDAGQFPRICLGGLSIGEVYASCSFFWERYVTGVDFGSSLIMKLWRTGKSPTYSGVPRMVQSVRPGFTSGQIGASDKGVNTSDGEINFNGGDGTLHRDQWNRSEMWFKLSTPGVGDGVCGFYSNLALDDTTSSSSSVPGFPTVQWNACPTRGSLDGGDMIEQVMLPFDGIDNNGLDNAYYFYVDNLYIDNTPLRVEIGDSSVYASCTERVIAPATVWTTTQIQASAPTSRWVAGQTVYAYVIGASNTVVAGPFEMQVTAYLAGPALLTLTGNEQPDGAAKGYMFYDTSRGYAGTAHAFRASFTRGQPAVTCGGGHYFGGRFDLPVNIPEGYNIWYRPRFYIPSTCHLAYNYAAANGNIGKFSGTYTAGSTNITLLTDAGAANSNFTVGKRISILLDSGSVFFTTIAAKASNVATLTDPLPSSASSSANSTVRTDDHAEAYYCSGGASNPANNALKADGTSGANSGSKWLVMAPDTGTSRLYVGPRKSYRSTAILDGISISSEAQNDGNLNNNTIVVPRDTWFSLQMHVFLSSTLDGGFIRVWQDNTFVGEAVKRTLAAPGYKIKEWGLGDYWNGVPWSDGVTSTNDFWMDDIIIATDYPGYGAPTTLDAGGRPYISPWATTERV